MLKTAGFLTFEKKVLVVVHGPNKLVEVQWSIHNILSFTIK